MVSQLPTGFSSFQRWLGEPQLHARESAISECSQVQTYAEDEALFFEDFSAAYVKLGLLGVSFR